MKVHFEVPAAGWLPLTITIEDVLAWAGAASSVPDDPILALAELAGACIDGLAARATLHLEPDTLEVVVHGGRMVLYEHESGRNDQKSAVVTAFDIDPTDVAAATWRGLRDLQGRFDGRSWPHPFPTAQVANLTQAIRRRKHDP